MATQQKMRVKIDHDAELAYVRFTDEPVARTVEIDEAINLDLDRFGVVIGIEFLDLDADIPFQRLVTEFHVRREHIEFLRMLRPNMTTSMKLNRGPEAAGSGSRVAVPC